MQTGRVKTWFSGTGYGFVIDDSTGEDVFVHARDLTFSEDSMRRGLRVRFTIEERRGKILASGVQMILR